MGAGKSTVGLALADLLGVGFCDTDHEIVARAGRSVAEIFADEGEQHFREVEAQVVTDVLATHPGVVALGGGAVMTPAVRAALAGHRVVHLSVTPEAGFARVRSSQRPLLRPGPVAGSAGISPEDRYRALLTERAATYRQVADITTDTTGRAPAALADEIARALGVRPASTLRDEGSPP
ncbi:shikimate kinase [Williamsia sp.]|uniref:shikimate kinase n=1 Tax=Williamsia sp. TaxID=1872085 RepID=UPI001A33DEC3|nr:shikimate kinase [Williamsia sp.]MBJ7291198.1 shikimate kinase [Williamsia sp.]